MKRVRRQLYIMPVLLLCFGVNVSASSLRDQLKQQTVYLPSKGRVSEQLIEVARYFHIPMAIEWLQEANEPVASQIPSEKRSVLELINAIVRQSPQHQILIQDRIVYVFPPVAVSSRLNFLNLRIGHYEVSTESVFGATAWLSTCINMMLYPELYKNGYGGGYGGGYPQIFWKRNVTISGDQLTIREILNQIAIESGNALWLVELSPDELRADKPKWEGVPINEYGQSPLAGRWHFISIVSD
jgi:hypothetical protein